MRHVARVVKRNVACGRVLCITTESALTLTAGWPYRNVQVVLKRFASVTDVLTAFDVDCCGFAFTGRAVLATARACRAVATKTNLIDLARRSQTYETRLLKYARRGYAIGADTTLLCPARVDKAAHEMAILRKAAAVVNRDFQAYWSSGTREMMGQAEPEPWNLARLLASEARLLRVEPPERKVPLWQSATLAASGPPMHVQSLIEAIGFCKSHGELPEESSVHHGRGISGSTSDEWYAGSREY